MNDVPRETVTAEREPAAALEIFRAETIERARAYTANLAARGEELGLIGPLEASRLWSRHVLNCALVAQLVRPDALVGDVGSGAGLPGLVLAIARPDARFVLIEPMERRCAWLQSQVDELGLENVEVVRARAEESGHFRRLDQVTARAVSALSKLVPITAPLVKPGGELIVMKGGRVDEEIVKARKQLAKLTDIEVVVLGDGLVDEPTRVFRATVI